MLRQVSNPIIFLAAKIDFVPKKGHCVHISMHLNNYLCYSGEWKRWRAIMVFVAVPALAAAHFSAFRPYIWPVEGENPHARPDFVPYEYLRIRTKVRLS